jgi:ferritin
MLSKAMLSAINEQIQYEFASAYLYLSMSAFFEEGNLPGFAKWMLVQAKEEQGHAMKFFDYVIDRGSRVRLQALEQPAQDWKSPLAVFESVLEHEKMVTDRIHALYALAVKENDYATQVQLQWFITEQVEEEKNATQIIEQLKLIEARGTAMLFLDKQLAKRGES